MKIRLLALAFIITACSIARMSLAGEGTTAPKWTYVVLIRIHVIGSKEYVWGSKDVERIGVKIANNATDGAALSAMGEKGWELVSVVEMRDDTMDNFNYYFKKPG